MDALEAIDMKEDVVTMKVRRSVVDKLIRLKHTGDSYSDVIECLISYMYTQHQDIHPSLPSVIVSRPGTEQPQDKRRSAITI